jgi:hypothetical protein
MRGENLDQLGRGGVLALLFCLLVWEGGLGRDAAEEGIESLGWW